MGAGGGRAASCTATTVTTYLSRRWIDTPQQLAPTGSRCGDCVTQERLLGRLGPRTALGLMISKSRSQIRQRAPPHAWSATVRMAAVQPDSEVSGRTAVCAAGRPLGTPPLTPAWGCGGGLTGTVARPATNGLRAQRAGRSAAGQRMVKFVAQGLRHGTPSGSKCFMFRVATVICADCAMAAIRASSNGARSGTR